MLQHTLIQIILDVASIQQTLLFVLSTSCVEQPAIMSTNNCLTATQKQHITYILSHFAGILLDSSFLSIQSFVLKYIMPVSHKSELPQGLNLWSIVHHFDRHELAARKSGTQKLHSKRHTWANFQCRINPCRKQ